MRAKRDQQGVTAVEIMLGVSLAALVLVFTTHTIMRFVNVGRDVADRTQALYLAEDGLELARYVRDDDWTAFSGLTSGNTYYLSVDSTDVTIGGTPEVIDSRFTRSVTVTDVERDTNDDLVTSGGTSDSDSRFVTVTVSWGSGESITLRTLLGNIHDS